MYEYDSLLAGRTVIWIDETNYNLYFAANVRKGDQRLDYIASVNIACFKRFTFTLYWLNGKHSNGQFECIYTKRNLFEILLNQTEI